VASTPVAVGIGLALYVAGVVVQAVKLPLPASAQRAVEPKGAAKLPRNPSPAKRMVQRSFKRMPGRAE